MAAMTSSTDLPLIHIAPAQADTPLTAQQKKFNLNVKRLETERALLAAWEKAASDYQERHARELVPLLQVYSDLILELAGVLDEASDRKGLSRADRETLSSAIAEMIAEHIDHAHSEEERQALKAIYSRHTDTDFDSDRAEAQETAADLAREFMQQMFDVDMDGVNLNSNEEIERWMREQAQAREAQAETERAAHQAKRRKPSARERRAQEDAHQATQSLREIYRKLAAELHPDRESDPAESERKTALMKRVNQAYEANNLLDLLQLQLEVQQIDPAQIAALGDERLKHYNRVLADQLTQLREKVRFVREGFCADFGLSPSRSKPSTTMKQLSQKMKELQVASDYLQMQLRTLRTSPAYLKQWIKNERAAQRQRDAQRMASFEGLLDNMDDSGMFDR